MGDVTIELRVQDKYPDFHHADQSRLLLPIQVLEKLFSNRFFLKKALILLIWIFLS